MTPHARLVVTTLLALISVSVGCTDGGNGEGAQSDVQFGRMVPSAQEDLSPYFPDSRGMNVLVISFDALRADALGVYGNERNTSPQLDKFATQSLVFDAAYTAGPVTPTSFASVFSGKYPVRVFKDWQFEATDTLAGMFHAGGYRSAAVVNNVQITGKRKFDTGFDHYDHFLSVNDKLVVQASKTWLDENRDKPFFLWTHFIKPHSPYLYRKSSSVLYDPGYSGPFEKSTPATLNSKMAEADLMRARDLYDGEVLYCDGLFGELVSHVEELGLLDNTVIIVTADHGEAFGEHGAYNHTTLHEEVIRIPLIIQHPSVRRGHRTSVLYCNVDLMPTLAKAFGLEVPEGLDGKNVIAPEQRSDRVVSIAMTDDSYRGFTIRRRMEKLLVQIVPSGKIELYDLGSNHREKLSAHESHPDVASALSEELWDLLGGNELVKRVLGNREVNQIQGLDDASIRALEATGYLGSKGNK